MSTSSACFRRGRPAFDDFKYFVADFGELNELVILVDGAPLEDLEKFADVLGARLAKLDIVRSVHVRMDVEGVRSGILGRRLFNYVPVDAYDRLEQRLTRDGIAAQVRTDREILAAPSTSKQYAPCARTRSATCRSPPNSSRAHAGNSSARSVRLRHRALRKTRC
jgi:hypothetical protein